MRWFICLFAAVALFSQEEEGPPDFWSTGPILNYAGDIVEMGSVAFQPYFNLFQFRGSYNSDWDFEKFDPFDTFLFQPYTRIGICPRLEIDLFPQLYYNHTHGAGQWVFGDFWVWLSAMLIESGDYSPAVLLELIVDLPTGKYQKLKESKLETDIGGVGSWQPGILMVLYKDFHLWDAHNLALTYSASYYFQTDAKVKGLSVYGGDETTAGKVKPGNIFQSIFSFEFSFTQNWLFSMDMDYQHGDRNRFSGETIEPCGDPSYELFALAPGLEYLWDENSGITLGSWFTVAGRNTDQFNSVVISIYLYR